jgi:hypothetical protein
MAQTESSDIPLSALRMDEPDSRRE